MTRVIILAGGRGERWGNYCGVPKHLAPVPVSAAYSPESGTVMPLLHRTISQFQGWGVGDIHVIADPADGRYACPDVQVHGRVLADRGVPAWVRTIPLWSSDERTIIVHGDWWFSTDAFSKIMLGGPGWWYGCRIGPSALTQVPYGEGACVSFTPECRGEFAEAIRRVDALGVFGALARTGSWELWTAMNGVPDGQLTAVLNKPWHLGMRVDLPDDGSGDFDFPRDYDAWWAAFRQGLIDV